MATLPSNGTTIGLNKTYLSFTNVSSTSSIRLGATLNPKISRSPTTQTPFSQIFGGRTVPFPYT